MRLPLSLIVAIFPALTLFAQKDSTRELNVYRSLLQEQRLPALTADNGKHVVLMDAIYNVNTIRTVRQPLSSMQLSYSTQWRRHGIGVVYEYKPGDLVWSNRIGIQYGLGIRFKRSGYWRNTKLIVGAGYYLTNSYCDFSRMTFGDQISSQYGYIRSTGEEPVTQNVMYPELEAGLVLRSHKFYIGVNLNAINEPAIAFYGSSKSNKSLETIINSGARLVEWKKFSAWIHLMQCISQESLSWKLGATLTYNNKLMLTIYQTENNGPHFRFGCMGKQLRSFIQYQKTDVEFLNYFRYGTLSMGLGYAIGNQ